MNEPTSFVSGDFVQWQESEGTVGLVSHFAPTWTLTYELRGPQRITITATQYGTTRNYDVSFTAATSDTYVPGLYQYQASVTDGTKKLTLWTGTIEVLANLSEAVDSYDSKSHVRKTLDAIETAIENYATNPYSQITIAGRTKMNWTLEELIAARSKYRFYLRDEIKAQRIANGLDGGGRILTRFEKWG